MIRTKFFIIVLVLVLSLIGGVYAAWNDILEVSGTAGTGYMDVTITEAFTQFVPGEQHMSGSAQISDKGKKVHYRVENLYPSGPDSRQQFHLRIRNNSTIPVRLGDIVPTYSGSPELWNYLNGTIHFRMYDQDGVNQWHPAISTGKFSFHQLDSKIQGLMDDYGEVLPGWSVRYSILFWLDPTADNNTQDKEVDFTLKLNWKQGNLY